MKRHGRKKPYTETGLRRLPCVRCGAPATSQWSACSDGNLHRPVCRTCDVEINRIVLEFMRDPQAKAKVRTYLQE